MLQANLEQLGGNEGCRIRLGMRLLKLCGQYMRTVCIVMSAFCALEICHGRRLEILHLWENAQYFSKILYYPG